MTFSSLRLVTPEVLSLSFLMVTSKSLSRTLLMSVPKKHQCTCRVFWRIAA